MIRKAKLYSRPKKKFELVRMKEENVTLEKYGLKNKREIWKSIAKVKYFRSRAKILARESLEEQEVLFGKLKALGLNVNTISEVLALKLEDLLERRLQTLVVKKGFAQTPKHARQMIVHRKVMIDNRIINAPSYIVPVAQENLISVKSVKEKAKPAEQKEGESAQ